MIFGALRVCRTSGDCRRPRTLSDIGVWRAAICRAPARYGLIRRDAGEYPLDVPGHGDEAPFAARGREAAPRIDAIPFESEHKFMATLNRSAEGEILLVKGAPEVILDHCEDLPKNLVLLGPVGLMDPPRKESIEAVRECHGGGIRVTMITGDHKITAAAIAKMLGIGDGKTAVAGTEIEAMNEAELQECVRDVDVFARASPSTSSGSSRRSRRTARSSR